LSVGIGLLFSLRFPGSVGDTVLAAAALSSLVGEALGPRALRGVLEAANEIGVGDDTGVPPSVSVMPDRLSSVPDDREGSPGASQLTSPATDSFAPDGMDGRADEEQSS
jgi:hypothetical protein